MTRDTNTIHNGGSKKFLYTGPKKKSSFLDEDEEVDQRHWSYNTNNSKQNNFTSTSTEFDLDEIWSIKKNINVPKDATRVPQVTQDASDKNVGKGFYSRHTGGVASELRTTASPAASVSLKTNDSFASGRVRHPSGKTWPRSYSYSYGNPNQESQGKALSPRLNKDFVKVTSGGQSNNMYQMQGGGGGGGVVSGSQSKYSVQRGGRPDNKHLEF